METQLSVMEARRPIEAAISEGNLAENPIFVLTNKEAKPLNAQGMVDLADYTRVLSVGADRVNGKTVERRLILKADPHYGYPTMFAYRLLLAIIQEVQSSNFGEPVVRITRHDLAVRLGYKRPSKKDYEHITNALNALRTLNIEFHNCWYDKKSRSQTGQLGAAGLIGEFDFKDDRQLALVTAEGTKSPPKSYVRLSDLLFESLKHGYFYGVDLQYMNELESPLAQRLYVYLTKKDHQRLSYVEGLRELAIKLNFKKRKPSAIQAALEPALDLLTREMGAGEGGRPRRFLAAWSIDAEAQQLTVQFYRDTAQKLAAFKQDMAGRR